MLCCLAHHRVTSRTHDMPKCKLIPARVQCTYRLPSSTKTKSLLCAMCCQDACAQCLCAAVCPCGSLSIPLSVPTAAKHVFGQSESVQQWVCEVLSLACHVQATLALQAASNMPAVKEAQKQVESLSWEGGYCPFSQSLQALNATALLRLHRSATLRPPNLAVQSSMSFPKAAIT